MSKINLKIYISLLVFWNFLVYLNVNAAPSHKREDIDVFKLDKEDKISANEDQKQVVDTGTSYKNDEEFHHEIQEKLDEHHKSKGVLFDRILLVNEIHKKWQKKYRDLKRTLKKDTDEVIIDSNLKDNDIFFEGDIILNKTEKDIIDESSEMRKRNAIYNRDNLWTSRKVPYTISSDLSKEGKEAINKAIQVVHDKTCIEWVTYNSRDHENYVSFENRDGCSSEVGRATQKGPQTVSIAEGCESVDTVLHEMTHAMGFFHEQSRDDRDKYIEILWDNIPDRFQDQFEKYSHGVIDKMGIEYNYNSLMHYSATAFGVDGKVTIKPIDATKTLGNNFGLSKIDIVELNTLYDCKTSGKGNSFSSWSSWTQCDTECYKDRQRFCFNKNKDMCPGSNIYGVQKETIKCTKSECPVPVDGHWSRWSSWGTCSKTCDEGTRQRTRECNNTAPKNGGKLCVGEKTGTGVCLDRRCIGGSDDADFENGLGIWSIGGYSSELQWEINSASDKSLYTGPRGDHTLMGQGSYIYVDSSSPRVQEETAILKSRILEFNRPRCLSFYYSMYGYAMGSLTLLVIPQGGNPLEKFTASGDKGEAWQSADVTLDVTGKFTLEFIAILGGTGVSDIALDDIFFDEGACLGGQIATSTNPTCEDSNDECPLWAEDEQCVEDQSWMDTNCKKSCGIC